MKSICVYCGSAVGGDEAFREAAIQLGDTFVEEGIRLVYGGGSVGLMGAIARQMLARNGQVLGIIPGFLRDREVALTEGGELVVTEDMHERKRLMFERSDGFVALPGGIGTLEELIEMMTWMQLGQHRKPIVIANISGFWDPLIALLRHMDETGFLHPPRNGGRLYRVVDEVAAVIPALREAAADLPEPPETARDPAELM